MLRVACVISSFRLGTYQLGAVPVMFGASQDHDVYKQRLSGNGSPVKEAEKHNVDATKKKAPENVTTAENATAVPTCGSCYGAEDKQGDCCNTCDEVCQCGHWGEGVVGWSAHRGLPQG